MAIADTSTLHRKLTGRTGLHPVWLAAFAGLLCAAPLLAVVWLGVSGPWSDYLIHIAHTRLAEFLINTAIVGLTAAFLAGVIGTGTAWLVTRHVFPGRNLFQWMLALPLAMPAYAAAYGWYDLTQGAGPLGGLVPAVHGPFGAGAIFGLVFYPYVYLLARESFSAQSADAYDAARTLGCSPFQAFARTALPMVRPAIAAGLALVVMEALADYGTVSHLGAPTLTVALMRAWAGEGSIPDAARLAMLLVSISFLIFMAERALRRRARQTAASGHVRAFRRQRLSPLAGLLAVLACLLPVLMGLVIPAARLGWRAAYTPAATGLMDAAVNSLALAGVSGLLAAGIGLGLAYAIRTRKLAGRASARIASMGYGVPGAVAALGVLIIFGSVQGWLDTLWRGMTGSPFPLVLTGSALALIFAYQARFIAAAIGPSESALSRVTPSLDAAARTLGARPLTLARRVHWPLVSSGVALAGLLVFVEVLKELPATMILRPFNMNTLAVTAHNYAADERLGQAALPAVLLVAAALPAMIWIARRITATERSRDTVPPSEAIPGLAE
ncbi:iron ABC transporter permease [Synechococcus moorigangaii CMS01]|nr:iron ABC transporter permease [Synechococcus moorigangaii CMS01]